MLFLDSKELCEPRTRLVVDSIKMRQYPLGERYEEAFICDGDYLCRALGIPRPLAVEGHRRR
jgi:hypothetical protein